MSIARFIFGKDGAIRRQDLREHAMNVAALTARFAAAAGLRETGRLLGLVHDMGKASGAFQAYLAACERDPEHPPAKGSAPHSPSGALYAHSRWTGGGEARKAAAQMIALCVLAHHEGLCDCLSPGGSSPYLEKLERADEALCEEASGSFFRECETREALDALFEKAVDEVRALSAGIVEGVEKDARAVMLGLAARFLLSCLVDADRWDSACFEEGRDPLSEDEPFDFEEAARRLEARLGEFGEPATEVARLRCEVSARCHAAGGGAPGIYTLTVPTGGGKTLASLRYALMHARTHGLSRIFYVIPFNTILDQNAGAIRGAIGMDDAVLEHHANVVLEREDGAEDKAWRAHERLTERWTSPVILTSMVHFLDSIYLGGNTAARRMKGLAGSVLIFDEVQAVPLHCLSLFKLALLFLTKALGCSVLLCTATQPLMDRPPFGLPIRGELAGDVGKLFERMKRVTLVDEARALPMKAPELVDFIVKLQRVHGGVLVVVNTRETAAEVFRMLGEALDADARFILTTRMCAEHRQRTLDAVKVRLRRVREEGLGCVLVSTSLIEAGVDISFPCGVRALCGLSSAIQTAGRVNRNAEVPMGYTYLVNVEESLGKLPEIRKAKERAQHVLERARASGGIDLMSPDAIRMYFEKSVYDEADNKEQNCPVKLREAAAGASAREDSAVNLLGKNPNGVGAWGEPKPPLVLRQAFRTVGDGFQVIDQAQQAVLVPFGQRGRDLIAELAGDLSVDQKKRALRRAQRYAVNLFAWEFRKLCEEKIAFPLGDSGAWAILPQYYDPVVGLTREPGRMETEMH